MGAGLVALACAVSGLQIYWHTFVDESENLYFGYRIARGAVLYRDMFSHHFPFPYWWIAAATGLAGKSITAVRLTGVGFATAAFASATWVTAAPLAVGIVAVVWSLVGYLYYGNLLIAYTFKSLSLMVLIAGVILGPASADRTTTPKLVAVGVFGAIALLTDPTAAYLVALIAGIAAWRYGWRAALCIAVPSIVGSLAMLIVLYEFGSLEAFVADTFRFNRDVYAIFGRPNASSFRAAVPYDGFWWQAVTGLKILDQRWWHVVPETSLTLPGALHDRWLLTGVAYRAYVIAFAILAMRQRDYSRAVGVYGFAVGALALRGEEGFHSSTFALAALLCGAALASTEWTATARAALTKSERFVRVAAAGGLAALALCGAATIWQQRDALGYRPNFTRYEELGRRITAWACDDPEVRVSYWPYDLLVNWFADRSPVSRYAYVVPWTVDLNRREIESAISDRRVVVMVDLDGSIGPWKNADYLGELLATMRERLVERERGVFVSRELLECR